MFVNITLHYFRFFGSFSNLYRLVKMLTTVMMKMEGVTKEERAKRIKEFGLDWGVRAPH